MGLTGGVDLFQQYLITRCGGDIVNGWTSLCDRAVYDMMLIKWENFPRLFGKSPSRY